MEKALVRIHARLCGDGNITTYETAEPDRNRRGAVVYTNYCEKNLAEFKQDMKTCFGVETTRYEEAVKVKSLRIVNDLIDRFGSVSSSEWRVPEVIKSSPREQRLSWLRAFIRDEGYYDESYNRLRIKCMNYQGLVDVKELFLGIDVEARITGPNCDRSYYLTVGKLDRYPRIERMAQGKKKVRS